MRVALAMQSSCHTIGGLAIALSGNICPRELGAQMTTFDFDAGIPDVDVDVEVVYTNYRGETAVRRIRPSVMKYGSTPWHPEYQWLLVAFDYTRGEDRTFAIKDIGSWRPIDFCGEH